MILSPSVCSPRDAEILAFPRPGSGWLLRQADEMDRAEIHRLRHAVYAHELGQHSPNSQGQLRDRLDEVNIYLLACRDGEIAGFISITPPAAPVFSIEKYFAPAALPLQRHAGLHEIRLLTVLRSHRGQETATLLMYAALRWVEAHGGTDIVAIGRHEVADLYRRVGLRDLGLSVRAGAVNFDLMAAPVAEVRARSASFASLLKRLEARTIWQLPFPFQPPAACFHGGAFFAAIGERFDRLERRRDIINADVLDAWFPPAPGVLAALEEHLPWLLRTSPPTACTGLIETIAAARGVAPENILPGAGSSDLIFRALRHWLTSQSRVLLLDPTYGEYAHVLEKVIGCHVERFPLRKDEGYVVDPDRLATEMARGHDLVVLVNPNSPTGRHLPRPELAYRLRAVPPGTRVWIDETYVDFAGSGQSLEAFAASSENVIVCKSMSKAYALSGARVAYLCAGRHQLESLRAITPPWVVGLPAQLGAVRALEDPGYYRARYAETAGLREQLAAGLRALGWEVLPGIANFLLCHVPEAGPSAPEIVRCAREAGLYLRDASLMGASLGNRVIRIAVKDAETNRRMLEIFDRVLAHACVGPAPVVGK